MSVEPIKREVVRLLADANEDIREAETKLWRGSDSERVRAAGELLYLKRQRQTLQARLEELEHCPGGALETTIQWLKEEGMLLRHQLEQWLVH